MTDTIDREAIARIPRELRKERGWSGARSVGIVKLIEERLRVELGLAPPPAPPVDPDLIEAREIVAEAFRRIHRDGRPDPHGRPGQILKGECDGASDVQAALAAVKRGRELAATEQAA